MSKLTVDIMRDFVASLDLYSPVVSFSDDGTNTTLVVENIYHARRGMTVDVDGTGYVVVSVDYNACEIVLEGVIANPLLMTVPNPFYFHGTPIATNNHIALMQETAKETVPMIYLYEILTEEEQNILSSIQRESDIRFFFLDSCNNSDWLTDDHYSYVLRGLNLLVDAFIDQLREDRKHFFTDEVTFRRVNHANWGNFVNNKGHIKRLFNGFYTGVELAFTLPIRKCTCCNSK